MSLCSLAETANQSNTFSSSRDFLGQACNDTACCIMLV